MKEYQNAFIQFALQNGVLKFGQFKLKSGRISPYFFNAGLFNTGASLLQLGRYYAQTLLDKKIDFDILYGPAYKGIPLAAVTAAILYEQYQIDIGYAFNRKEAKDHGEGGSIVGHPLKGRVLIIDDVITAGTSIRESIQIIQSAGAEPAGVLIALDRQERGQGERSAIQEIEQQYQIPVLSIIQLDHLIHYMADKDQALFKTIQSYRQQYGLPA